MRGLVERLRYEADINAEGEYWSEAQLNREAADHIETMERQAKDQAAEIARLREALHRLYDETTLGTLLGPSERVVAGPMIAPSEHATHVAARTLGLDPTTGNALNEKG